jgi:phage-related tail fiber protein
MFRRFGKLGRGLLFAAAVFATFSAGVSMANSGNYCENIDDTDCAVIEQYTQDSCCKNLDSSGYRNWTCTREQYFCLTPSWEVIPMWGPGYNCVNPGASCN